MVNNSMFACLSPGKILAGVLQIGVSGGGIGGGDSGVDGSKSPGTFYLFIIFAVYTIKRTCHQQTN